ncbi:hypothetical protein BDR04DRAFT_1098633 [Suillus decipiens]|nr:hypothetical protein BDR04DRAFT_1098633 [Suillus decipiens]
MTFILATNSCSTFTLRLMPPTLSSVLARPRSLQLMWIYGGPFCRRKAAYRFEGLYVLFLNGNGITVADAHPRHSEWIHQPRSCLRSNCVSNRVSRNQRMPTERIVDVSIEDEIFSPKPTRFNLYPMKRSICHGVSRRFVEVTYVGEGLVYGDQ